jgi:cold-inducible RNA-binding protein
MEKGAHMATNLFIGNLPYSVDDAKLADLFTQAGTVVSAKVIKDKYSGRSRGFGFVEMSNDEETKKAIELLNGKDVDGRPLVVNEARPPKTQE